MYRKHYIFIVWISLFFPTVVFAKNKTLVNWHSTNIQLLRGFDYALGHPQRTIFTLEHANDWVYGDFFVFGDQAWSDNNASSYYIEPTLRISLNKLTEIKVSQNIIKDVLFAVQFESQKGKM